MEAVGGTGSDGQGPGSAGERRAVRWVAAAWAFSTVGLPLVPGGPGGGAVAALLALLAGVLAASPRGAWRDVAIRRGAAALALTVAAAATASLAAGGAPTWALRWLLAGLGGLAVLVLGARDRDGLLRALAEASAVLIGVQLVLALVGPLLPTDGRGPWVMAHHADAGFLPRFQGSAGSPGAAGLWLLLAAAAAQRLCHRGLRAAVSAAALLLALATLSLATLLLPAGLAVALLRGRLRVIAAGLAGAGAVTLLWCQPIALRAGEIEVPLAPVHPGYHRDGRGPVQMPMREVGLGPLRLRLLPTAYFQLARRGLECWGDNPLAGVGPDRFAAACLVWTMNTYGIWSSRREPHNQYTGLLAEQGILGLVAWIAAAMILRRAYTFQGAGPWFAAAGSTLLLAAAGGEVLIGVPAAVFAAAHAVARRVGPVSGRGAGAGGGAETPPDERREGSPSAASRKDADVRR